MSGDILLVNGRIVTMDPAQPHASALAIRQGRIIAVGDEADVRERAGAGLETLDLAGRTATPGLNDAHAHPMSVGFALGDLDLNPADRRSVAEIVDLVVS